MSTAVDSVNVAGKQNFKKKKKIGLEMPVLGEDRVLKGINKVGCFVCTCIFHESIQTSNIHVPAPRSSPAHVAKRCQSRFPRRFPSPVLPNSNRPTIAVAKRCQDMSTAPISTSRYFQLVFHAFLGPSPSLLWPLLSPLQLHVCLPSSVFRTLLNHGLPSQWRPENHPLSGKLEPSFVCELPCPLFHLMLYRRSRSSLQSHTSLRCRQNLGPDLQGSGSNCGS